MVLATHSCCRRKNLNHSHWTSTHYEQERSELLIFNHYHYWHLKALPSRFAGYRQEVEQPREASVEHLASLGAIKPSFPVYQHRHFKSRGASLMLYFANATPLLYLQVNLIVGLSYTFIWLPSRFVLLFLYKFRSWPVEFFSTRPPVETSLSSQRWLSKWRTYPAKVC